MMNSDVGQGGAAFPAGRKWSFMLRGEGAPAEYIACNADEMEPGTSRTACCSSATRTYSSKA